jgi:hypothetical protein
MGKRYRQLGKQAFKLGISCRPSRQNLPGRRLPGAVENRQNRPPAALTSSWHASR